MIYFIFYERCVVNLLSKVKIILKISLELHVKKIVLIKNIRDHKK